MDFSYYYFLLLIFNFFNVSFITRNDLIIYRLRNNFFINKKLKKMTGTKKI
jgi:hypothetical protein